MLDGTMNTIAALIVVCLVTNVATLTAGAPRFGLISDEMQDRIYPLTAITSLFAGWLLAVLVLVRALA